MAEHRRLAREEAADRSVGDVMVRRPKTLPAAATVGDVRRAFENPKLRLALLADGDRFVGAIVRAAIPADAPDDAPATAYTGGETGATAAATPLMAVLATLDAAEEARLVVLDPDGATLRGLLCLHRRSGEFCLD